MASTFPFQFIHDPHLPLSHLTSSLERYQTLLPSLDQSVSQILRDELRGGQILSLLHDRCSSGVPDIQKAYEQWVVFCLLLYCYKPWPMCTGF